MPLLTLPEALTLRESLRAEGKALVLTNGIFDLLHLGHVEYLERARALGGALFVGVNGDGSARQLKGDGRPFVPAAERARLISALACVTAAVLFDDLTAIPLVRALRPETYAKGGDYADKFLPEAEAVREVGGRIVLIEYAPRHSTTKLISRIRQTSNDKRESDG
jgi:rfaE bifunctional protein nucleotidyltransferase chain/domain